MCNQARGTSHRIRDHGHGAGHAKWTIGPSLAAGDLQSMPDLGVLRCVDHQGKKVTLVGKALHVRTLVASGKASDPSGMTLSEQAFPLVVNGLG